MSERGISHTPELSTLPSALDPAVHSMHKARALVASLAEVGVDAAAALRGTGIQASDLDNVGARMSIRQLIGVFRNASQLASDPMFALRAGHRCHLSVLGYFGIVMSVSENWTQSMTRFVRYRQLSTPVLGVKFAAEGEACVMTYFDALDIDQSIFNFILDYHMGMCLNFQRDLYGPEFCFLSVNLSYPAPAHAGSISELFEAPVTFSADHNQVLWSGGWNESPIRQADPLTALAMSEICDQLCAQINAESGKAGIVTRILETSDGGFPGIDEVAGRMNVTSRTLRRWLLAEGTSYAGILDAVRARIAIRCLRSTNMKADQIASSIGFSTTASFRAAFRRWTGRQPSHFRPRSRARGDIPQVGSGDGV